METATYRLARTLEGVKVFAEVTVSAGFAEAPSIRVAAGVFDWLKDEYGPYAREWPACESYRAGALSGARHAARNLGESADSVAVVVERIRAHPSRSTPESVALATCCAVWRALGVSGSLATGVASHGPTSTHTPGDRPAPG